VCGRIIQSGAPYLPGLTTILGTPDDPRIIHTPRYNGAPSQLLRVIRRRPDSEVNQLDMLQWGLIPSWTKQPKAKPINATCERVASAPMFRSAYAKRRCLVPVDGFYEWKAIEGSKAKQPYAIGLKSGEAFGLAGIWESWKKPDSNEIVRTFCIITCEPNSLMASVHDRMPVIIRPAAYERWLSNIEPDPRDLLAPYPAELMRMWPVSTRVNSPKNDDANLLLVSETNGGT
jgi:putative SOS response-associated peptidase YedK